VDFLDRGVEGSVVNGVLSTDILIVVPDAPISEGVSIGVSMGVLWTFGPLDPGTTYRLINAEWGHLLRRSHIRPEPRTQVIDTSAKKAGILLTNIK
jgi:hypothetical protein